MHKITQVKTLALLIFLIGSILSLYTYSHVEKVWKENATQLDAYHNEQGQLSYRYKGQELLILNPIEYDKSQLSQSSLDQSAQKPSVDEEIVFKTDSNGNRQFYRLTASFHFGIWSLLTPLITISLCLLLKEPMTALFSGVVIGSLMLGYFDLISDVFVPVLSSKGAATVILLYLWLLGGLLGIWSRTGAAQAFADFMCANVVKGPKSAKLVSWFLGIIFFQGGSISTVLVGTTVKPLADKAKVSHEESSYIVDSTASPIASVLAFNPWPAYVQALIFIPGVAFLATETDRIAFFFKSIPFSFYSILAVLGTLLLSLNITRFSGAGIRNAITRVEQTGELDSKGARPLNFHSSKSKVPTNYRSSPLEFIVPILLLISIAIATYVSLGIPKVEWAFSIALFVSIAIAAFKGMDLRNIIDGLGDGFKSVVTASVILIFAITVGKITSESGGGLFLIDLLGDRVDYRLLPMILMLFTMVTAFSTGTSWGTYAIAFPLAFPLAWAIAGTNELVNTEMYMMICFAAILNGSVYGDQCSPISDTTVLSAMTTGCDLMDHVKTQFIPATYAAILAIILWTFTVTIFV